MIRASILGSMVAFSLLSSGMLAAETGKLQINGFISQGYINSQENSFLDPNSIDGSFQVSEVGLTFTMPVNDKLRIGMQLLSNVLGEEGGNEVNVDWAYADYRAYDWLGLRVGKIKQPLGLYNETRDSDFLRPMAFLPQSVYDEMQRGYQLSALGLGTYGNVGLGALGDLDYQLFYGQQQISNDGVLVQAGIKDGMNQLVSGVASAFGAIANVTEVKYQSDYAMIASITYNSSLDGLRLAASYKEAYGDFVVDVADPFGVYNGIVNDFDIVANVPSNLILSAEYQFSQVNLQAEFVRRENEILAPGLAPLTPFIGNQVDFLTSTSEGMYVMATWQAPQVSGLSFSLLYDEFYLDEDDHKDSTKYRKDLGLGVRYDINQNWLVKAEWHDIEGTAMNMGFVNEDAMKEDWSYFIVKTSFNF